MNLPPAGAQTPNNIAQQEEEQTTILPTLYDHAGNKQTNNREEKPGRLSAPSASTSTQSVINVMSRLVRPREEEPAGVVGSCTLKTRKRRGGREQQPASVGSCTLETRKGRGGRDERPAGVGSRQCTRFGLLISRPSV